MAKMKVTYDDGTSAIVEVPEDTKPSQPIPGTELLGGSPPPAPGVKDVYSPGQPSLKNESGSENFEKSLGSILPTMYGDPVVRGAKGVVGMLHPDSNTQGRLKGASEAVRGFGQLAATLFGPELVGSAGLLKTGLGVGAGLAGQKLGEDVVGPLLHAGPGGSALTGDALGGALGYGASNLTKLLPKGPVNASLYEVLHPKMAILRRLLFGGGDVAHPTTAPNGTPKPPPLSIMEKALETEKAKFEAEKLAASLRGQQYPPVAPTPTPTTPPPTPAQLALAKFQQEQELAKLRNSTLPTAPLSGNTNSLKPAGTGAPPAPFNPQVPTGTNTGQTLAQQVLASRPTVGPRTPATGSPLMGPPASTQPPLATPQQAQEALLRLRLGATTQPQPTVAPSQTPISGNEEQSLPKVAKMLQLMIKAHPEMAARASSSGTPVQALPPLVAQQLGVLPQVTPPSDAEILKSILGSLGGTFDLGKPF